MNATLPDIRAQKLSNVVGAVLLGVGVGRILSGGAVTLPAVGAVPSLALGAAVALVGAGLWALDLGTSDCGCGSDCDC